MKTGKVYIEVQDNDCSFFVSSELLILEEWSLDDDIMVFKKLVKEFRDRLNDECGYGVEK